MSLVGELIKKQKELGLSDRAFARKLGISQPVWSNTKKGLWKPGMKLMRAAVREFPSLNDLILKQMSVGVA